MLRLSTLLLSALLLAGCTGDDTLPTGRWRAVATVPGGALPFGLDLERTEDGYSAALLNGGERIPVREVEVTPDSVHLNLPAFNARIAAARDGAALEGTSSNAVGTFTQDGDRVTGTFMPPTAALPMLNRVLSYPTALFVGRDGRVRYIHTGFYGPGTGARYEALSQEFTDRIEGLLAESPPANS